MLDALLSVGSPHLKDVTLELLQDLVADHPASSARRRGFFKMSRVLAANGFNPEPLVNGHQQRGTRPETVASVPPEWLEMVLRWRKFSTNEPGTVRTKFPLLLVAGRWAAERHPEATSPQAWTRDIAAEYIADTMIAVRGQWAGHNRNRTGWGEPLNVGGKTGRVDSIRSFFCDLIQWEWITRRFAPRRVLAGSAAVGPGRARPGPPDHRRCRLGQAHGRRTDADRRRPARLRDTTGEGCWMARELLPDRNDPRPGRGVAVRRAPDGRDTPSRT
ncbi:hypothetical protein GCM10010251_94070 [Streptomyces aurantiogriseus]|uniref:Uncharacterized protein n=1 Tax=Streptomyces aurantiogriseus TaxID=66870 RepID=A0A918FP06_9ACTN|nr:hypothetical protein GCM10010251_94070 [Streptomyces aurantiogriseus]